MQAIQNFSSGSGSGGGFTITKLWDYVEDNSGSINYGIYSKTLHQSVDDFDMLVIELMSLQDDAGSSSWGQSTIYMVPIEVLKNSRRPYYFNFTSFGDRASAFHVEGTTCATIAANVANTNGLVRVYGIKY